jgi:hypothetical protein
VTRLLRAVAPFVAALFVIGTVSFGTLAVPSAASAAPADTSDFTFASYDADYCLSRDADVPFESDDDGRFTQLALGADDYVHGRQSYVITFSGARPREDGPAFHQAISRAARPI